MTFCSAPPKLFSLFTFNWFIAKLENGKKSIFINYYNDLLTIALIATVKSLSRWLMMKIQLLLEWDGMSRDVIFVFPKREKKKREKERRGWKKSDPASLSRPATECRVINQSLVKMWILFVFSLFAAS